MINPAGPFDPPYVKLPHDATGTFVVCDCHGTPQNTTYQLTALAVCTGVIENLPRKLRESSGYRQVRNPMAKPVPNPYGDFFAAVKNQEDFGQPNPPKDASRVRAAQEPVMPQRVVYGYNPQPVDAPSEVLKYINRTYSLDEISDHYSDLRNSVIFGKDKLYTLTVDPPEPAKTAEPKTYRYDAKTNSYSSVEDNLTGRENSAILNDIEPAQPEETSVTGTILSRNAAEAAYKRAAEALGEIDRLEKKYSPDLPDGSVVAFVLKFAPAYTGAPSAFHYAAIRAAGHWFTTGKISPTIESGVGLEWSALLETFEKLNGGDFEILRTGGITPELEDGFKLQEATKQVRVPHGHQTVVVPPDSVESFDIGVDAELDYDDDDGDDDDDD